MGAIPILRSCTVYAEDLRIVKRGAALGGSFLGTCALILYWVTLTDPILSSESDLPMLALRTTAGSRGGSALFRSYCSYPFSGQLQAFLRLLQKPPENDWKTRMGGHPLWQDWQSL